MFDDPVPLVVLVWQRKKRALVPEAASSIIDE